MAKVVPVVPDGGASPDSDGEVSPDPDGKVEPLLDSAEVSDLDKRLLKAAVEGQLLEKKEEVKELLQSNANIEAKGGGLKQTPLHFAAKRGHRDIVDLLLKEKADIEAKNVNQSTPLHFAVGSGHRDIVDLLLEKKADIEAKDACQSTFGEDLFIGPPFVAKKKL